MSGKTQYVIGVDVGTGGVRAVAVPAQGGVAAAASVALAAGSLQAEADRHEQPPEAWWDAFCRAIGRLAEQLHDAGIAPGQLAGISVDGTSGTLVVLDGQGNPLRPAMMYNDARATRQAEELNRLSGEFCQKLGYRFNASFALAKIAWLQQHEPDMFRRAAWLVHQADFVLGRLTGDPGVSDYSNALKTGYDLVEERWPAWIDEALGIRDRLPRVVAPGTRIGVVCAAGARQTGLPEGLPVVAGATDGTAAFLASGARRPGEYNTTLGTTLVFKGISRQICRHPLGLIYCHKLPGGLWLPGAASNTGTEWLAKRYPQGYPAVLDAEVARLLPTEVVAYPLARPGERFPFLAAKAVGFGMPMAGGEPLALAAGFQGVAFVERLGYEVLDEVAETRGGAIFSTGGGSRNDVWMQCRADVTGRVNHRPAVAESAYGAAILAAAGTIHGRFEAAIEQLVHVERSFDPDSGRREAYDRLYRRFRDGLARRGYW